MRNNYTRRAFLEVAGTAPLALSAFRPISSHRQRVEQAIERFNTPSRREEYFELYSSDVVFHGYTGVEPGLANVRRFYEGFWSAIPDAMIKAEDFVEQGDKLVLRYSLVGTHRGVLLNVPATGKSLRLTGMSILRFSDTKCVERWTESDSLSLLVQMGAVSLK